MCRRLSGPEFWFLFGGLSIVLLAGVLGWGFGWYPWANFLALFGLILEVVAVRPQSRRRQRSK